MLNLSERAAGVMNQTDKLEFAVLLLRPKITQLFKQIWNVGVGIIP